MGSTLFNTTPQNTYPSLIKLADNLPLSATLKTLSDGLGNDSVLALSTNSLQIGGTTGATWDNTNKRLGVGTNAPSATAHFKGVDQLSTSTSLLVQDSIGTNILRVHNQANNSAVVMSTAKIADYEIISGNVLFNTSMRFVPTTGGLAINKDYSSASSNTLVHLKGSGSTSATTSLLVKNSAGDTALQIKDNREFSTSGGDVSLRDGALFIGSNFLTTYGQSIGFFGAPVSSAIVEMQSTTRGFLPPRMTTTQRDAIATPATGLKVYNTTTNTTDTYDGTTWQRFGQQTFIKGSGSTSATTSLLVQNSGGSSLFSVFDDGSVNIGTTNGSVTLNLGYNNQFIQNQLYFYSAATNIRGMNAGGQGLIISKNSGTTDLYPTALLAIDSTTQGFLPPRMTTTQKNAIATPAAGLVVYDSTTNKLCCYNGSTWNDLF